MANAEDYRILVVDDEPDVRRFLAACIADAGFSVDTAMDGVEALEKVGKNPPHLITLDMVMPRKSGIRFMRELRKEEKTANIPVIVITAHARDEFGDEEIRQLNAFTARSRPRVLMEKPVTPSSLVEAIRKILEVDVKEPDPRTREEGEGRERAANLLEGADPNTLARVLELLEKSQ